MNAMGMRAVHQHGYKPFVDFSCRREPDFDNKYPSISALCRKSKFAPHLKAHDIVIYTTLQGVYPPISAPHYRLVAILQIEQIYPTHHDGEIGYNLLGAGTPRNCMVPTNLPLDFDQTAGDFFSVKKTNHFLALPLPQQQVIGRKRVKAWDNYYQGIPSLLNCGAFVRTTPVYLETANPAPIYPKDYASIFGKPSQAPKPVTAQQLHDVGLLAGLDISLGQKI
jgi:hypothetical protein